MGKRTREMRKALRKEARRQQRQEAWDNAPPQVKAAVGMLTLALIGGSWIYGHFADSHDSNIIEKRASTADASTSTTGLQTSTTITTSTVETAPLPPIPGLAFADINLNLESRGLECKPPTFGVRLYSQTCSTVEGSDVLIIGPTLNNVTQIIATSITYDTRDLLEYVATVPYEGSSPVHARNWVHSHLVRDSGEREVETKFGAIPYGLYGIGDFAPARMLEIGWQNPPSSEPKGQVDPHYFDKK